MRSLELRQPPGDGGGGSGLFGGTSGGAVDGFLTGGTSPAGGTFGGQTAGGTGGTAGGDGRASAGGTAGASAAAPAATVPGRNEICNGADDDCDNLVDEGFDLQIDPANCGACGKACSFSHAAPLCQAGQCALGACFDGYADADKQAGQRLRVPVHQQQGRALRRAGQRLRRHGSTRTSTSRPTPPTAAAASSPAPSPRPAPRCVNGICTLGACMAGLHRHQQRCPGRLRVPLHHQRHRRRGLRRAGQRLRRHDRQQHHRRRRGLRRHARRAPASAGRARVTCVNGTLICLGAGTPGTEVCDGKDNDCDGMTDEDDPFAGQGLLPGGGQRLRRHRRHLQRARASWAPGPAAPGA